MLGDSSRAIHLRGLNCVGELFGGEKAVLSTGQVNDMSVSFGRPELEGWNRHVRIDADVLHRWIVRNR